MLRCETPTEKAVLTRNIEIVTVILTVIYSFLAFHDFYQGKPMLTSPSWYYNGFCEAHYETANLDSHALCFIVDMIIALPYVVYGTKKVWDERNSGSAVLLPCVVALVASFFTILHGLAHLDIHLKPKITAHGFKTPRWDWGGFFFLGVTPFLGWSFGVPWWICLAIHVATIFVGTAMPTQFAFGFVQLLFNFWIAIPRLALFGVNSEQDIKARISGGWFMGIIGMLVLMPITFAEMLACESFYRSLSGHTIYDLTTASLTAVFASGIYAEINTNKAVKAE